MAIGETVLGAVLQVVFDRLASREVINFFHRSKFDQSLIEDLTTLMLTAGKLLLDAEEKQMTDKHVKLWLENLKHWFYRAEEVVDEIATEALQSSLETEWPSEPQSMVTKADKGLDWSKCIKSLKSGSKVITSRSWLPDPRQSPWKEHRQQKATENFSRAWWIFGKALIDKDCKYMVGKMLRLK